MPENTDQNNSEYGHFLHVDFDLPLRVATHEVTQSYDEVGLT